jgi:hypothetical protein
LLASGPLRKPSVTTEETTMSEPMTDADLTAIERLLMYGVIGTDPADASGATTDDVAEVAGDLLAEVRRLQDEVAGANENVASWQGIAADLRADRDYLEDGHYVLLSQCYRLEEERNQLRDQRIARVRDRQRGDDRE